MQPIHQTLNGTENQRTPFSTLRSSYDRYSGLHRGPFVGQISWSGFWGAATELPDDSSLQDWGVTEDNAMAVMMQVELG